MKNRQQAPRSAAAMRPAVHALALALFVLTGAARVAVATPTWLPGPLAITPSGANGPVISSTLWDPDGNGPEEPRLVVGGDFTSIEGITAKSVAVRNPHTAQWEPLGAGLPNHVYALAVYNGDLIAAGAYLGRIARWDGSAWQDMGDGLNAAVLALCVYNGDLYAGGYFTASGGDSIKCVARWNGTTWSACGSGMNGPVWALDIFDGEVIAGGQFTTADGLAANRIAAWNGTSWHALGAGVGGSGNGVFSLAHFNGELIAGGNFDQAGGNPATKIARWNGSTWQPMGALGFGEHDVVQTLRNDNGDLVAGISVYISSDVTWDGSFARWNGSAWTTLATMDDKVECILRYDNEWVVGGDFTYAASTTANHLARFGTQWAPFGGGSVDHVSAFLQYRSRFVAAGLLQQPTPNNPASNIVAWDGLNLSSFGTGINGPVSALETFSSTVFHVTTHELIAGGFFTQAGGLGASNIARWDETPSLVGDTPAWQAMGLGFSNGVYAIKRFNGQTYAGGGFLNSGGTRVNYIARWNETSKVWEALSGGMNGPVYALEVYGSSLYVGGTFTTAGGLATGGLARFDGTSWSSAGGTFPGAVLALEVGQSALWVGGIFTLPNAVVNLATYYGGSTFYGIGANPNDAVDALEDRGGLEYFGGQFTTVGGTPANHLSSRDLVLEFVGNGADGNVLALNLFHDELNVGGGFATVGNGALASTGWARYSETGVPWIVSEPTGTTASSGGSVTFSARPAKGYTGLTYQWYRFNVPLADGPTGHALNGLHAVTSGSIISGARSATLGIQNVRQGDAGQYSVIVSNASGGDTSAVASLTVDGVTAAPLDIDVTPTLFESIGPNPTGGTARLAFRLEHAAEVQLHVHDIAGRLVRTAEVGHFGAGRHTTTWDGTTTEGVHASAGLYFVSLDAAGTRIGTRRLAITR